MAYWYSFCYILSNVLHFAKIVWHLDFSIIIISCFYAISFLTPAQHNKRLAYDTKRHWPLRVEILLITISPFVMHANLERRKAVLALKPGLVFCELSYARYKSFLIIKNIGWLLYLLIYNLLLHKKGGKMIKTPTF